MHTRIGWLVVAGSLAVGCQQGSGGSTTADAQVVDGGPAQSAPMITTVVPGSGPTAGGTAVTVTGTGFQSNPTGLRVVFGAADALNVQVVHAARVVCTAPPGSAGPVAVTVLNPDGGSAVMGAAFTYVLGPPTVTGVSPSSGPVGGGTGVTVTGTNFVSGATVQFGGAVAGTATVVNSGTLTVFTPPGSAGSVAVTVTNPGGQSATLVGGFTYTATGSGGGPGITAVSPVRGPATGGTSVTLAGGGFASGATVTFGGVAATAVSVSSAAQVTCVTPAAAAPGFVNVVLTNPDGRAATAVNGFEYRQPPSVAVVRPPSGGAGGGTRIVIYGTGFDAGATVGVAGAAATGVAVNGPGTEVTAVVPAGAVGAADVVVTNPDGSTAAATGGFTYVAAGTDPTVWDVDAGAGPAAGGNTVTIAGTGLTPGTTPQVWFGRAAATAVTVVDPMRCTATVPAGTAGTRVAVHLTDASGRSATALSAYGYDTAGTAPTFTGLAAATDVSAYAVELTWASASDDVSTAAKLRYRVWWSTTAGGQSLSSPPAFESAKGAAAYVVGGLTPGTTYYFVVRAADEVGNEDGNTVERVATTRASSHRLVSVASMNTDRAGFSLSSTPDGRPIAVGGWDGGWSQAVVDRFETGRGAWRQHAFTLTGPRDSHSAVTLADGRVLVTAGNLQGVGVGASAELFDPATEGWSMTGALAEGRYDHTATLLYSGRVLVAGGATGTPINVQGQTVPGAPGTPGGGKGPVIVWKQPIIVGGPGGTTPGTSTPSASSGQVPAATAEVYDPTSGSWAPTGSPITRRYVHTATRLADGRVLLAGGLVASGTTVNATAASERFDESTGTFTATGQLVAARSRHTATRLFDGRVLAAGGVATSNNWLASAELFDPSAGAWSTTAAMAQGRAFHDAVLLPNGWVMAIGGVGRSSVELYDPTAATWVTAPSLPLAVGAQSSTLLRTGAVLTAGGFDSSTTTGSRTGSAYKQVACVADVFQGGWHPTGAMPAPRRRPILVPLADGRVLATGGDNGGPQAHAWVYDPRAGTFTATTAMRTARDRHTATLLPGGFVLVAGGASISSATASAELYDPATATWYPMGSMATAREGHTATLIAWGHVLVAGGRSPSGVLSVCDRFDPSQNGFVAAAPLSVPRERHAAVRLPNGHVLVVGGGNASGPLATAETYDPAANAWSGAAPMAVARRDLAVALLPDGRVLVAGGDDGTGPRAACEVYDPSTNAWTPTGALQTARVGHRLSLLPSGRVLAVGGAGAVAAAEVWDPATGAWQAVGSLGAGRSEPGIVGLSDGRVLVAGGDGVGGALASVERYDEGLGYACGWRPAVRTVDGYLSSPTRLAAGATVTLRGSGLRGGSEGGGGTTDDGRSDAPLVVLAGPLGGGDGQVEWWGRATTDVAGGRLDFVTPSLGQLPSGFYALRVFVHGIPSVARVVELP